MLNVAELCALLAKQDDGSFVDSLLALRTILLLPSSSECHLNIRCCDQHSCFLTDRCLLRLLDASKRETLSSTQVHDIGRLLNSLVDTLRSLRISLSSAQKTSTLKYVWQYWDYPAEATRHQCIKLLESVLRLHLDDCVTCREARVDKSSAWCNWLVGVLETVVRSGEGLRSRYKALLCFATLTSPSTLTEKLGDDFPERLLLALNNRSVTVVVSELLCFLLSGASESQMRMWTTHLAAGLSSDCSWLRASLKERVIPLLFKNNSRMCISLLEEMSGELNNNPNNRTLDARLSIARLRLRFDKSSIESLSWNQLLDDDVMEDSLSHAEVELRLSAWHLLIDQPKLSQ
uniref:tRNA (32-2'-O)-methyltransferase regulator THADA-like TPR repeats region domain-containing protein n=1 Tax=Plectus sambesii TaxID=2011161 RepID=A0A914VCS2_9BILA